MSDMSDTITYTIPMDSPVEVLRGVTLTGGVPEWVPRGDPEYVQFPPSATTTGKPVRVRIADKPDLLALVQDFRAREQAAREVHEAKIEAAAPGWHDYQEAQNRYVNAAANYDRASEHGYPPREARAMQEAAAALSILRERYPLAAAYAKIIAYTEASNYLKVAAGRRAQGAVLAGSDAVVVMAAMESEWANDASRAVDNS